MMAGILRAHFPGSPIGTYSEAMAYYFDQELLSKTDVMVELHGGDIPEALTPFVIAPVTGIETARCRDSRYGRSLQHPDHRGSKNE